LFKWVSKVEGVDILSPDFNSSNTTSSAEFLVSPFDTNSTKARVLLGKRQHFSATLEISN
jgi:hypothetical protein